jgi:tripartite-type tricarboxylate transporter receptor subunit TctC
MESGLPSFEVTSWYGLWFPQGTPRAIVQKLQTAVAKAFEDPDLNKLWFELGAERGGSTPEEFRDLVARDVDKWARVVREARITIE